MGIHRGDREKDYVLIKIASCVYSNYKINMHSEQEPGKYVKNMAPR